VSALPTGTVTFLFTDIERSSNLWERSPDAMREALADHDAILREATARYGGTVFKTIGDAFCCAFAHADEALEAAVDAQRALANHVWPQELGEIRVRMGIHSGKTLERDGDYFGPTVNRVSRLTAIGSGGQILASSATVALVRANVPQGLELIALGMHRLRDLSQSEPVFQVAAEGIRAEFPALASLDVRPNNLPSQFSSFVGREREIGELHALLGEHRLVTVAGTGGIGKTRLAVHLAAAAIHRFDDGAWFVELASVADPALVAQTIAGELGVREERSAAIAETLLRYLERRRLLLVIDNAEHLLGGVAAIVKAILSRCAEVSILVTSREPLHLTGEQVYRLSSMPEAPVPKGADDLTRHDTTRLFVERARANAPAFVITDQDAPEIAGVCRKLEGIPLAIELAAARVSTLSVRQLNERLSEKLPLLASRDSTQERHRTLRGTIDWSYRLLSDEEKRAFSTLSVCSGGFTLEACERIARSPASSTVDLLESLVEKSFVQVDPTADVPRFRCLDVMREYASGELAASGSGERASADHARYYAEFAARGRSVSGEAASVWHRRLDEETHNLRAALDWCAGDDPALGGRIALDLSPYWRVRSTITEARARLRAFLCADQIAGVERAALLCCAASFATMQDDFAESLRLSREGLLLYRAAGDALGTGEALFRIAEVEHRRGRLDEANRLYEEARGLFVEVGNARGEMLCLANLGMLARQLGDYRNAKLLLADALARATASGEGRIAGEFSIAMGWVDLYLGDFSQSRRRFEAAFAQKNAEGDRYGACGARHGLATVALQDGRLGEALESFAATIESACELRLQDYAFRGFHGLSACLALGGDVESAAVYLGLAEKLFRESGRELRDSIAYDVALDAIRSLPQARQTELLEEGARLSTQAGLARLRGRGIPPGDALPDGD
jgi:predicted ATPase/class 3 adenylate cyclase